jgi:hypothetical protein
MTLQLYIARNFSHQKMHLYRGDPRDRQRFVQLCGCRKSPPTGTSQPINVIGDLLGFESQLCDRGKRYLAENLPAVPTRQVDGAR